MNDTIAIARYEELLLHKTNRFYLTGTDAEKEQSAISVLKYIITGLLNWTPQEAVVGLTPYIAKQLHVDLLMAYINQPRDVLPEEDYDYLVHMAYPDDIGYNPEAKIIRNYNYVIKKIKPRFPKNYFNRSMGGKMRARCILGYVIDENLILNDHAEIVLYKMFSDNGTILPLLKKWKLKNVCKMLYDDDPVEYLHDTLIENDMGTFLYNFYSFKKLYDNVKIKRDKSKKKNK